MLKTGNSEHTGLEIASQLEEKECPGTWEEYFGVT
jgi:hypothetical protein